ncbi:MAG: hypothetical protein KA802_13360 [Saprospiraceae bacterium]|nr:hypothetical protein [Saprospiraceae bacterium]
MKKLLLTLSILFQGFNVNSYLLAQESEIYEIDLDVNVDDIALIVDAFAPISHLPGSPIYSLVLIKEDMEEAFKPNELEKIKWKIIISNKRLKEAYVLMNSNEKEAAKNNIFAYISSLEEIKNSITKLKSREDMPVPTIYIENNLTTQQKILTYFYNSGMEIPSSNAIKANIELLRFAKQI